MLLQRESIEFAWQYLCFCIPISWLSSANIKAVAHIPNPKIKEIAMKSLEEIKSGRRDFRF